jgi:hypothetical protein
MSAFFYQILSKINTGILRKKKISWVEKEEMIEIEVNLID